jgi:ATP/maltotriose-dependent transcriptional regulator MalT
VPGSRKAAGRPSRPDRPVTSRELVLTEREREILSLAADLSNREIAKRLSIADRTVKRELTSAFRKLGVSNRRQAVAVAAERELV